MELGGTTTGLSENAIRQAAFQIASLMNSTGFATADFAQWDAHAQMLLLFAMFIGGSAGSTGGGIKVIRWLVVLKTAYRELYLTVHPDVVKPVRLGGAVIDEDAIRGIMVFTLLYMVLFGLAAVFFELDAARVATNCRRSKPLVPRWRLSATSDPDSARSARSGVFCGFRIHPNW